MQLYASLLGRVGVSLLVLQSSKRPMHNPQAINVCVEGS